jgi:hypothetical protein
MTFVPILQVFSEWNTSIFGTPQWDAIARMYW